MLKDGRWALNWDSCSKCGRTSVPHQAHGLCRSCYNNQQKRRIIICKNCGEKRPICAHDLCAKCYDRQYQSPIVICKECGKEGIHVAHGLCINCYQRLHERPLIICKECGIEKPHMAYGLCSTCYSRKWSRENRKSVREYHRQYYHSNCKDKHREYDRKRRARLRGAAVDFVDEQQLYGLYGHFCIYCGSKEKLTLDHVVPLAGGGIHSEDNLVIACLSCNSSKCDKPLMDWLRTQPCSIAWLF